MRSTVPALLLSFLVMSGCGTVANPMNWFGNDGPDEAVLEPVEADNPLIPETTGLFAAAREERARYKGTPIEAVTDLTIERVPGGLLVRATGLAATQGVYDARLTPGNEDELPEDGVLTFRLEAQNAQIGGGAPQTREVIVARRLTEQQLGGARTIRVEGVQNALERRR